ncbi:RIP metalloprotease [Caulobacter sp. S45]|uniref:M50 family metallopeptidase n=1 Tax=Caulobacter sp. S45 TaxID=1641861 RepID=UPI0015764DE6|nr:RIP metalloprotease [Caulobacter sp. S45]
MIASLYSLLTTLVPFIFVLTLVITVHEMGHFLVARWLGVAVDRFSIGFGRAIASWRDKSGVEWRVGWIPLGGYVRFAGDADASSSVPDANSLAEMKLRIQEQQGAGAERRIFHFKPVWVRALVVMAGPLANFILAITLFAVLLSAIGETTLAARVAGLDPKGPAARAGFRAGDLVLRADGQHIDDFMAFKQFVALRSGEPIAFAVQRCAAVVDLVATPERRSQVDPLTHSSSGLGYLGVLSSTSLNDVMRRRYTPVQAVRTGVERTWGIVDTTVVYLSRLIRGKESGDQLGGPLRIASTAGAVAKAGAAGASDLGGRLLGGFNALLYLAAVLSVGIGFMNLLPIPVLDGGHLVFYAYEALARRPMAARIQSVGYRVGLALLLSFMLFATWNDLQRLNVFKFFGGLFS